MCVCVCVFGGSRTRERVGGNHCQPKSAAAVATLLVSFVPEEINRTGNLSNANNALFLRFHRVPLLPSSSTDLAANAADLSVTRHPVSVAPSRSTLFSSAPAILYFLVFLTGRRSPSRLLSFFVSSLRCNIRILFYCFFLIYPHKNHTVVADRVLVSDPDTDVRSRCLCTAARRHTDSRVPPSSFHAAVALKTEHGYDRITTSSVASVRSTR